MKVFRIFQIAAICAGLTISGVSGAYAQGRMTPEQKVQNQLDKMKAELSLTDDQAAKIKPILSNRQAQMMQLRNAGADPETMKAQRKTIMQDSEKQIAGILTPEQLQKYKIIKSQMKPNRAPNGGDMQQPGE